MSIIKILLILTFVAPNLISSMSASASADGSSNSFDRSKAEELINAITEKYDAKSIVILGEIIKDGADVNAYNAETTPLLKAIKLENVMAVRLLISKGANVNQVFKEKSPLMEAVSSGKIEIIKLLIQKGADVDFKPEKDTYSAAIKIAIDEDKTDILKLLIEKSKDINQKSPSGSLLHYSISEGKIDAAIALIEGGIDLSITDRFGHTATSKEFINNDDTFKRISSVLASKNIKRAS